MDKYIYDKSSSLWYELKEDYYFPCLTLHVEEEKSIGLWGQRHLWYIQQYRRLLYINLLTNGNMNSYLPDIDRQAEDISFRSAKRMTEKQGITEQLKAND